MSYFLRIDSLFPGGLSSETPEAASWRCFFEQRVDLVQTVRGLSRAEAECAAYDQVLITFLNKTHPNTSPDTCAECGKPEAPDETLLPFGFGARHAWLHSNCWAPWRAQRRVKAEENLARLGVMRPTVGAGDQGQCPDATPHSRPVLLRGASMTRVASTRRCHDARPDR
jgi:hypothetical protein